MCDPEHITADVLVLRVYCCNRINRIHMRFTTTNTHTKTPKTETRQNNKVGNPEAGNYVRNFLTLRCVLTHTTHNGYDVRGCKRGVYRRLTGLY